jgi:hypothetical protein
MTWNRDDTTYPPPSGTATTNPWPDTVKVTVGDRPTDVHIPWVDPAALPQPSVPVSRWQDPLMRWHPEELETFQSVFRAIFGEAFDLLVAKQRTYGSANVEQLGFYGIFSRLAADKVERLRNLMNGKVVNGRVVIDFAEGDFGMNESVEDTIIDIANYAFIMLALKRGLWGKPLGPD